MRKIDGDAKGVRELLGGAKFAIDYYQREYRWEKKQIAELIEDLSEKFLDSYEAGHQRREVKDYGHYFLGSVIISNKDGHRFIIDGQQRLTTLSLLLIYIYRQLNDPEQKGQLADLIFSQTFGERSFNLDVPERVDCMDALFHGQPFEENHQPESVVNILRRYQNIEDGFPDDLKEAALPFFADWLIERVYLVEITAYTDADAYTIFETMNDRGLSLTPTDMLKGYLLANITAPDRRDAASRVWRERIAALQRVGKEEDADSIKSWLRSQHAQTIRERISRAEPRDFDLIGTQFHRWVRDHEELLGLDCSDAFWKFIECDFAFYSSWYKRIRHAAETLTPGLEAIHYNSQNNFTLQYPALLAPLRPDDSEEDALSKLRVVARYIDTLIARRIWNGKSTSYSTMQYNMFQIVILKIRRKSASELADILSQRLSSDAETFATNSGFRLHGMNGRQIHRMLARMTDVIETHAGRASRYSEYIQRRGRDGYEIEHIWADHPEQHTDEFGSPSEFADYRNRIGGLLLLPKSFNASFGDKPYVEKREHYYGQNLLARSLHDRAYQNDPGFVRFVVKSGLRFQPHGEFKRADMDARQQLYQDLAEQIWDPANIRNAAQ